MKKYKLSDMEDLVGELNHLVGSYTIAKVFRTVTGECYYTSEKDTEDVLFTKKDLLNTNNVGQGTWSLIQRKLSPVNDDLNILKLMLKSDNNKFFLTNQDGDPVIEELFVRAEQYNNLSLLKETLTKLDCELKINNNQLDIEFNQKSDALLFSEKLTELIPKQQLARTLRNYQLDQNTITKLDLLSENTDKYKYQIIQEAVNEYYKNNATERELISVV